MGARGGEEAIGEGGPVRGSGEVMMLEDAVHGAFWGRTVHIDRGAARLA
jgi:hypothetical protein